MSTQSTLQISPSKHLLLGIILGVGLKTFSDVLLTVFYTFLSAIFWDMFGNNANIFGLLGICVKLGLLIVSLMVLQKIFKSKFVTIGTASGFVGGMILGAVQAALMFGR